MGEHQVKMRIELEPDMPADRDTLKATLLALAEVLSETESIAEGRSGSVIASAIRADTSYRLALLTPAPDTFVCEVKAWIQLREALDPGLALRGSPLNG